MYSCKLCSKSYARITSLYGHTKQIHGVSFSSKSDTTSSKASDSDDSSLEELLLTGKISLQDITDKFAAKLAFQKAYFYRPTPKIYLDLTDCTKNNIIEYLSIIKDGVNLLSLVEDLCVACRYADVFTMVFKDQIGYNSELNLMQYYDGKNIASIEPNVAVMYNIYSTLINKIATTNCKPMKLVSGDAMDNLKMDANLQNQERFFTILYTISEPHSHEKAPKNKMLAVGTILLAALNQPVFNVRFNGI